MAESAIIYFILFFNQKGNRKRSNRLDFKILEEVKKLCRPLLGQTRINYLKPKLDPENKSRKDPAMALHGVGVTVACDKVARKINNDNTNDKTSLTGVRKVMKKA